VELYLHFPIYILDMAFNQTQRCIALVLTIFAVYYNLIFGVLRYCDVLPGNASVICVFWILCSVYWINRQAEFTINYYL
jgi:hypothetical protein